MASIFWAIEQKESFFNAPDFSWMSGITTSVWKGPPVREKL